MVSLKAVGCGIAFCIMGLFNPSSSYAQSGDCRETRVALPLDSRQASAGFFANLRGAESSIKYQSDKILQDSTAQIEKASPPSVACPKGCRVASAPQIVFHAAPNKYLSEYDDRAKCQAHYTETIRAPLTWLNGSFEDYQEFSERFADFTQGDGPYGEELYEKCDGDCSPQYTIKITPHPQQAYSADVFVVCGHARDKDDAMYTLATSLVWECVPVS